MTNLAGKDFASLLDDLVAAHDRIEDREETAPVPTIPFDYLAVADELHSGRVRVADDILEAEYRDTSAEDFEAFLFKAAAQAVQDQITDEELLPVEPEAISSELCLDRRDADYGQIRRRFAFANHPDRVAPHLRQRAMVRMQVANMLIDAAARR